MKKNQKDMEILRRFQKCVKNNLKDYKISNSVLLNFFGVHKSDKKKLNIFLIPNFLMISIQPCQSLYAEIKPNSVQYIINHKTI